MYHRGMTDYSPPTNKAAQVMEAFYELPVDNQFRSDVLQLARKLTEEAQIKYQSRKPITLNAAVETVLMTMLWMEKK